LTNFGVIITDSTSQPLRLGTTGVAIAHSGFSALHDYAGQKDLFDRPYKVERANVAGGLAAAAVVAMGEGSECTPLCLLNDMPFVQFVAEDPSNTELAADKVAIDQDLFAPFLQAAPWQQGRGN
jgi:F420-0:gamma-glutamyl ligase